MNSWQIYIIGFLAQILFSGRIIFQWILSERKRQIVNPALFWYLSLLASILLFLYGYLRDDPAIMFGQLLTYFIYIRNLQLMNEWPQLPLLLRLFLLMFPFALLALIYRDSGDLGNLLFNEEIPAGLLFFGILGQTVFISRFFYQWIFSEINKHSYFPQGFWVLSLVGSILILIYAVIRRDPVLLVGHLCGFIIYIRNLIISRNEIIG